MAIALVFVLYGSRWKRKTVKVNCDLTDTMFSESFLLKLLYNLSVDLMLFLHGSRFVKVKFDCESQQELKLLKSNGGIVLSSHYSNYEFSAQELRLNGVDILGPYMPMKSRFFNSVLRVIRGRQSLYVSSFSSPRDAIRRVEANNAFGFMVDQFPVGRGELSAFFSSTIKVSRFPLLVFEKTNANIFYVVINRRKNNLGFVYIVKLILKQDDQSMCEFSTKSLQGYIQQDPTYWYGYFHKLFKHITPGVYR